MIDADEILKVRAELTEIKHCPMIKVYNKDEPTKCVYLAFSSVNRLLENESNIIHMITVSLPKSKDVEEVYRKFVENAAKDYTYVLSKAIKEMHGVEKNIAIQTTLHFKELFTNDVEFEKENNILSSLEI